MTAPTSPADPIAKLPQRIQRRRAKGWHTPPNTIYVGRPTEWGNPFLVGGLIDEMMAKDWGHNTKSWFGRKAGGIVKDSAEAVALYRMWVADCEKRGVPLRLGPLRGKNLACWCPLDQPCHADVLLEIANG